MIQPLFDRVLLKQVEQKQSSILLPDQTSDSILAEVVALGKDCKVVNVGDNVIFNKYATSPITHEGNNYLLIKEIDILATF